MDKLTHFSDSGRARMVDVSEKSSTQRVAIASGVLHRLRQAEQDIDHRPAHFGVPDRSYSSRAAPRV